MDHNETIKKLKILEEKNSKLESENIVLREQAELVPILQEQVRILEETIRLHKIQDFGPHKEILSKEQLNLFNEPEKQIIDAGVEEDLVETLIVPEHERKRGKRTPLSEAIPRVEVIYDLDEASKSNATCIGEEVSEKLDLIPAKLQVLRIIRKKYKLASGEIVVANAPKQAIPKSNAGPGLLAHLVVGKFQDHLPLYRQEEILNRIGMQLPRSTTSRWMIQLAQVFTPIYNLMKEDILKSDYIHCDETTVQVLKEEGRKPENKSYMWVLCRGGPPSEKHPILFTYEPSRSGGVIEGLLDGFKGYLQTDGYKGYNIVAKENTGIIHLACWAHVRRKFVEAVEAMPKKDRNNSKRVCVKAYLLIKELYKIESEIEKLSDEEKKIERNKRSTLVLIELKELLKAKKDFPEKTYTGKALNYMETLWEKLIMFLQDGRLNLDNNRVENAIRPFAVGRRNWLFSANPKGAEASAILYSIIESAKACDHNPYLYVRHLVEHAPKAEKLEDFEKLLPYSLKPEKILEI